MQKLAQTFVARIKKQRLDAGDAADLVRSTDALLREHPALHLSAEQVNDLRGLIENELEALPGSEIPEISVDSVCSERQSHREDQSRSVAECVI
jgi:hypothetical protein